MSEAVFNDVYPRWRSFMWKRVRSFAKETGFHSDAEDLYQECCIVFDKALEDFNDHTGGGTFYTFLTTRINATLISAVRKLSAESRDFRGFLRLDMETFPSPGDSEADMAIRCDLPILLSETRKLLSNRTDLIVFDEIFSPMVPGLSGSRASVKAGVPMGFNGSELALRTGLCDETVVKALANVKNAVIMSADRLNLGEFVPHSFRGSVAPHEQIAGHKTAVEKT